MLVFYTIIVCMLLVIIHEVAHAYVGVKYLKYTPIAVAVGIPLSFIIFGKKRTTHLFTWIFTWKREEKIPIVISWLLIGGGVVYKDTDYYNNNKYPIKVLMLLAGPVSNIIAGFLLPMLVFGFENGLAIAYGYFEFVAYTLIAIAWGIPVAVALDLSHLMIASIFAKILSPWWMFICLWMLWNFSVGYFNLIPLPGLDGGHVLMQGIQKLCGEKSIPIIKIVDIVCLYLWIVLSLGALILMIA